MATVKLSLTSTFNDAGFRAASRAMSSFNKEAASLGVSSGLATSFAEASVKADQLGSKLDGAAARMQGVGSAATAGITLPLAAAGAASFQLAADFETSMSQVSGALNDPAADMEGLRQLALQMGQDTVFSATECGSAMVELAKGGLTEADIKAGALKTTMDLAAAGSMGLGDAANAVVQAMGAFGLAAGETGEAANALAGAAAASSADVSDLTQGLSQASAQANSAGWSIQDTAAALGAFADAGITGSDAGTSLKTMLQRLAAPTDTAAGMMESLGIVVRDSSGNMLDAAGVAEELKTKLGGLSSAEKDAAMQTIFGSDASRAALVMANQGREGIERYTAATNDQTAAQRLADSQMGESARAIEEMKGAVETASIKLGGALAPAVTEVAGAVGDAAEAFSSLSEGEQEAIVKAAALAAAVGPVTVGAGKLVGAAGTLAHGAAAVSAKLADWTLQGKAAAKAVEAAEAAAKAGAAGAEGLGAAAGKAGAGMATAGEKARAAASKFKLAGAAMGLAKVAAAGLAVAGVAVLAAALVDAARKQQQLNDATEGLEGITLNASAAMSTGAASVEGVGVAATNAAANVQGLIEKQSQLAATMQQRVTAAAGEIATLGSYGGMIQELAGKSDLTAQEQAKLQLAVDKVNEACGTGYAVAQDQGGAYQVMADGAAVAKGEIDGLVQSQQAQMQLEALSSNYADVMAQKEEAAKALAAAQKECNQALSDYRAAEESGMPVDQGTLQNLANKEEALKRARDANDSLSAAERNLTDLMTVQQMVVDGTATAYDRFVASNSALRAGVDQAGQSTELFRQQLAETGVSVEALAALNDEQLAQIGLAYDGTTASVAAKLREFGALAGEEGSKAGQLYADGVSGKSGEAASAASQVTGAAMGGLASADPAPLGEDFGMGYAGGIVTSAVLGTVATNAAQLAVTAMNAVKAAQDSASPSKESMGLGEDFGAGYELGIAGEAGPVAAAAASLASAALGSADAGIPAADAWCGGPQPARREARAADGPAGLAGGAAELAALQSLADRLGRILDIMEDMAADGIPLTVRRREVARLNLA